MGLEVSDACRFCIERGISNKKSGQITRHYVSLLRIAFFFIMSCFSNITLIFFFFFNNCCHKKIKSNKLYFSESFKDICAANTGWEKNPNISDFIG